MALWESAGTGIWVREYDFGGNPVNTAVVDVGGGKLLVLSPGTNMPAADFDALDALGTVSALVAPGAFHHMGLPEWSARYPNAGLYGPTSAIAHIAKQHPTLKAIQSLDALRPSLPPDFELDEVAGCKHPDVFLAVKRADGTTWFTNELVSNNKAYPANFFLGLAFKLTGNHPGLNVNSLAAMLIRAKKPLVREYLQGKLQTVPPTRLVPMHGAVLEDAALGQKLGEVLRRRF